MTRTLSELRLPPTIEGILASRIDRLSTAQKDLLQTLAVIGRQVPVGVVSHVASFDQSQLERILADLQAGEFIYEHSVSPGVEYVFKHALVQEVAYNSLLIEHRKQLHERAGAALESLFARQLDDHVSELAHHYSRSNNINKAVEYLDLAGRQAMRRSANAEAINNLTTAVELLQNLPDGPVRMHRELQLQLSMPAVIVPLKGWGAPELERVAARARELCERLGNPPEFFATVYFYLWFLHWLRAELTAALEMAHRLLEWAENSRNHAHLLLAHHAVGVTLVYMGELPSALKHEQAALSLYDPAKPVRLAGIDGKGAILSYIALVQWLLGYPDEALKRSHEAVGMVEDLADPRTMLFAEVFLGVVFLCRGDAQAAHNSAQHQIEVSSRYGFIDVLQSAGAIRGAALSRMGLGEEGLELIQKSLTERRASGSRIVFSNEHWLLTEECIRSARVEEGMRAVNETLALASECEVRLYEAEGYRLKGELILAGDSSNIPQAQACFERAIAIARKQSAKSWELCATTSLARLLAREGRRAEARAMLAEIYNWFTEGFDTADLKEAKALLDELSR